MKVVNQTKKTVIAEELYEAKTLWQETIGMLKFAEPKAMLIHTRFGIHTFFMKYPIDVIILNRGNTVVKLKKNMKPNQMLFWNPQYGTILELPSGSIQKSHTTINDNVKLAQESY